MYLSELPGIGIAAAQIAASSDYGISGHDHKPQLFPARLTQRDLLSVYREAGLHPPVPAATEAAGH
jgi:hypothetical protein